MGRHAKENLVQRPKVKTQPTKLRYSWTRLIPTKRKILCRNENRELLCECSANADGLFQECFDDIFSSIHCPRPVGVSLVLHQCSSREMMFVIYLLAMPGLP